MEALRFEAALVPHEPAGTYLVLPADVSASLGGRGRVAVSATIAGQPYRGSTMPAGDGTHRLGVTKAIQAAAALRERFDALAYSHRREHVQAVEGAKQAQTRARRIDRCVEQLAS
jgi:hypothetical protein